VTIIATGFERRSNNAAVPGARPESNAKPVKVSLDDDEFSPKKNFMSTLGADEEKESDNTIEFPDVTERFNKYNRFHREEPYVKANRDREEEERQHRLEAERRRKERLANISSKPKLSNPQAVNELENVPAYLRKGINLEDVPGSDEIEYSKWTISESESEPQLREGNSFLHDNVD
jgi:cell division protein FtsZ